MNNVRYYSVLRPIDERRFDEITLEGKGWQRVHQGAQAQTPGNQLKLKFKGTRVDLVLLADSGAAAVLIDGKAPSKLNLFHGLRPLQAVGSMVPPAYIVQYFTGPDMQVETWEMIFKDISPDGKKFSFSLRGSVTGEDGEGSNTKEFVSKSGRITIAPRDWLLVGHYPPEDIAQRPAPKAIWRVVADYRDQVKCGPVPKDWPQNQDYFQYVTVADGLAPGEHELTLIPDGKSGGFSIHAVEAFNPPMACK
jgi:hypothetical protein